MSGTDPHHAAHAMSRAIEADNQIWTTQHDSARHRRTRDHAVAEALRGGISKEHLADKLGVLISDIEQMAAAAHTPPTQSPAIDNPLPT